ncbi:MAG: hypothetical protein GMKNLPBB_02959 [Myxococcota bacterium]|nr:hypothetical protein [Myxococcota bacterium]
MFFPMNRFVIITMAALMLLAPAAMAQNQADLNALRGRYESALREHDQISAQLRQLDIRHKTLAREIEALKRQDSGAPGAALTGRLQESERLSSALTSLQERQGERARAVRDTARLLAEALEHQAAASPAQASALLKERDILREAVSRFDDGQRARPVIGVQAGNTDGPVELREKADLLADQLDRNRKRLEDAHSRLDELKREQQVRRFNMDIGRTNELFNETDRTLLPAPQRNNASAANQPNTTINANTTGPANQPAGPGMLGAVRTTNESFSADKAGADAPAAAPAAAPSPAAQPGIVIPLESMRIATDSPASFSRLPQDLSAVDDITALEAEAARLETLNRELESRRGELLNRARALEPRR